MTRLITLCIFILLLGGCAGPADPTRTPAPSATAPQPSPTSPSEATTPPPDATPSPPAGRVFRQQHVLTSPPLTAAALSPDGTRLAVSDTVTLTLYTLPAFDALWEIEHGYDKLSGLQWSPDGAWLLGHGFEMSSFDNILPGYRNGLTLIIDAENGEVVNTAQLLDFSAPNGVITPGDTYKRLRGSYLQEYTFPEVRNTSTRPLPLEEGQRTGLAVWSPDGRFVAYTRYEPYAQQPELVMAEGEAVITAFGVTDVQRLTFSPGGGRLAVHTPNRLTVFAVGTGERVWSKEGAYTHGAWLGGSFYTQLGGRLQRLDAETGDLLRQTEPLPYRSVQTLPWERALTASGGYVVVTAEEGLTVVDALTLEPLTTIERFSPAAELGRSPRYDVALYHGERVAVRSLSYTLIIDANNRQPMARITASGPMAWSPDGTQIAMAGEGAAVTVYDASSGAPLREVSTPTPVTYLYWPTADVLLGGQVGASLDPSRELYAARRAVLWAIPLEEGDPLWQVDTFNLRHMGYTPGSPNFVYETDKWGERGEDAVIVARVRDGGEVFRLGSEGTNTPPSLSPDGSILAREGAVAVAFYDVATGEALHRVNFLEARQSGYRLSPFCYTAEHITAMLIHPSDPSELWQWERATFTRSTGQGINMEGGLFYTLAPGCEAGLVFTPKRTAEIWAQQAP